VLLQKTSTQHKEGAMSDADCLRIHPSGPADLETHDGFKVRFYMGGRSETMANPRTVIRIGQFTITIDEENLIIRTKSRERFAMVLKD
jgi:hypothetical protein